MNSELKAYLDKLRAETRALYAEFDRQFPLRAALPAKPSAGAPPPPLTRSAVVASDGDPLVDSPVVAVVPDGYCFTAKAQEILEVAPDAPPTCTEMAPITCSTKCSTQIDAVASADEVQDGATTVHPVPAANLNHKEVAQTIPVQAKPFIGISTSSSIEVVFSTATSPDIIPSVAKPAPTKCSAEAPVHATDWMQPLVATIDNPNETHDTATAERLHPFSFEHQPWPPPVQVQISHMGQLFRPTPWPSFCLDHARGNDSNEVRPIPWPSLSLRRFLEHPYMSVQLHGIRMNSRSIPKNIFHSRDFLYNTWEQWHKLSGHCILLQNYRATFTTTELLNLCVDAWSGTKILHIYSKKQPCPPPLQAGIRHMRHMFRPRAWPSFDCFHEGAHLKNARPQLQVTYVVQLKSCSCEKLLYWIPMAPRAIPLWNQQILQLLGEVNRDAVEWWSMISSVQSSYEVHDQENVQLKLPWPSFSCDYKAVQVRSELPKCELPDEYCPSVANFALTVSIPVHVPCSWKSIEHQVLAIPEHGYDGTKLQPRPWPLFEVDQETTQLKLQWTTCCCNCRAARVVSEQYIRGQLYLRVISMLVCWQFLSQEKFKGSGRFDRECRSEKLAGDLNFLRESLRCLTSVQPHEVHHSGLVLLSFRGEHFIPVCCCGLIPREEPFLCLPGLELLSVHPPVWATSDATLSSRAEEMHWEQDNYKHLQFSPCYIVHSRKGAEFCVHLEASYEFYLEKFALMGKLENNASNISVKEIAYSTSIWGLVDCTGVIWIPFSNEEASTSTVIQPVRSYFNGFASSCSVIHSVHEFSYRMPSTTAVQWVAKFGALILGKLPWPLVQLKHPWPFPASAMSTLQVLFHMKTFTKSVTILKIYSRMFQDWIAHLLGSTSASGYHLEQLCLSSNLCSTRTLTSPMHYMFEFWSACVLSICMQMRVEKPMTSGELNQWMAINFLLGTLELESSLDKLLVLLGFLPPFCSQSSKSTSRKICVLGTSDDLGSFTVVQGGYRFSASHQENFQGGRSFIIVAALFVQDIVDHKFYLDLDQVPHGSDYYLSHDRFSKLIQVHLKYGYHHDNYHGDLGMIKDLQAPWDPGEFFMTAAWGQAAFQEGRDVRDLLGLPFGRPIGLALRQYMG